MTLSDPRAAASAFASLPTSMTAVTHDRYGPPHVLRLTTIELPSPGPDKVLLRVRAAGVSRGVWHMMTGMPRVVRLASGLRRPRQVPPGMDVCGEIVGVGSEVRGRRVGQRVFGLARGSFAEYAVAKATHLTPAPPELTDIEAGVLAESGLTALQALDAGGVGPSTGDGCRVLIIGASGGVGSLAVTIAALHGAEVTAVCSAAKADFVAGLGAAHVIDYRREDPLARGRQYDVILDGAGGATLAALRGSLAPRGTLVFVGNESGGRWTGGYGRPFAYQARMALHAQRFVNLLARTNATDLARLADLARDKGLRPRIHATYPLTAARTALEALTSGVVAGKIAIRLAEQEHS